MNFDGLRDTVVQLLVGEKKAIDTTIFTNGMVTFNTKDDVLTLLVHLGYQKQSVQIVQVAVFLKVINKLLSQRGTKDERRKWLAEAIVWLRSICIMVLHWCHTAQLDLISTCVVVSVVFFNVDCVKFYYTPSS